MKKEELKKQLDVVISQIKGNSKDVHFTDTLLDKLLSLKGQLDVEPTEYNVGKSLEEFKAETFKIIRTERGVLFKTYGGFSMFVTPTLVSLYETLCSVISYEKHKDELSEEEKDNYQLMVSVITTVLSLPMYVFSDDEFTFDIANRVIEYLRKTTDDAMNQSLQEEDAEKDSEFKEAVLGVDKISEAMNDGKEE